MNPNGHKFRGRFLSLVILALLRPGFVQAADPIKLIDRIDFGQAESEKTHHLAADHSETLVGGLGVLARQFLPLEQSNWEGGKASFTLKVDPVQQNYVTIRLWGDDVTADRLILYCEGKQIGYRHLGDVDLLDFGTEAPGFNGRFYYNTSPLPMQLTKGNTELHCEIRSTGRIWGYGTNFEQYQKPMTDPTRGVYAMYTHTDGCFTPPSDETQGAAIADPPVRRAPGAEVMDQVKARVNGEIQKILNADRPLNQVQMHLLAKAYSVQWTAAYENPAAVNQIVRAADALYAKYKQDSSLAENDPAVYNGNWFGLGLAGDAIRLLATPLAPVLDGKIDETTDRRAAWSAMLQASRDWHLQHRRLYTNQSMITDLNSYRANRGVAAIDPTHAIAEAGMLQYLYQSIGLQPWLGSETGHGPDKSNGDHYFELTRKGLTKELGYVGNYGEVLDWVTQIYDATRMPGQPGDAKIESQLEKIANARAVFRYPMLDEQGNRVMRLEATVGWRDAHYPGDVIYGERSTWDASCLYTAAATLDANSIGYAQQMFADNQFFASVADQMKTPGLRTTAGLLGLPDQYELVKSQPASRKRLPMTAGEPDFAWADEEDGVVAIKHGDAMFYASLYWRARNAVNFLARVHSIEPTISRIAVVREQTQFEPSGQMYTRPDWTNFGFGNGGLKYPDEFHSSLSGEKLPIAKVPADVAFKPGDENVYVGRGQFYVLRYGPYLIGMNCTSARSFELPIPPGVKSATDLVTTKPVKLAGSVEVTPFTTKMFFIDPPDAKDSVDHVN